MKYNSKQHSHRSRRRKGYIFVSIAVVAVFVTLVSYWYVLEKRLRTSTQAAISQNSQSLATTNPQVTGGEASGNTAESVSALPRYGISLGNTLPGLNSKDLDNRLGDIKSLGIKWIRVDLSWQDIQVTSEDKYSWASFDNVVKAANAHGLMVLPILGYTPHWARQTQCADSDKCAPANASQFATFSKEASQRYSKMGIHTWEIWNEPNLTSFWKPYPNPSQYAKLLMNSSLAIKSVDTSAKIISGSLAPVDNYPTSIDPLDFLKKIYQAGAKDSFDVIGYHPYSYPALPSQVQTWSGWSKISDLPISLVTIMNSYGDTSKEFWITEFGAPTNGPGVIATSMGYDPDIHPDHVTEDLQTKMVSDSFNMVSNNSRISALFWYTYKDTSSDISTNENFFGLIRANGYKKPAYYTLKQSITATQR